MNAIDGQQDILDTLGAGGDRAARKMQRTQAELTQLPRALWRQHQSPKKDGDYWYHVDRCIGCGIPGSRYGLHIDHGAQWDLETGAQVLPGGPGMSDQGVCMLMSFTRDYARQGEEILAGAGNYPPPAEWWGRCYAHDHQKRKCKATCWEPHVRHLVRMADLVWGDRDWRTS